MPNGAEEVLRRGDSREPPFLFLQGKVGYQIAPSSDPALPAHLPPEGKALGVGRTLPVCETTSPSPPSRGAGRYGRWIMGRRPGKKEGGPPQGPPNQKRWVQGGRTSSSLVFFPPAFFQRKPGSPAGVGGGNHVAGPTLRRSRRPQTWPPPGRRPTGRCAPRPVKAPPTWRVPIISPVAFLSRAPQNTARPPPAGRPPGRSTPRPPRLGGSSRPSPARGRRR